jgi:hypothetical protein
MDPGQDSWYLFEVPVLALLGYIERVTGEPFPEAPESGGEANKWHLALRRGLQSPLHLNVGIPGIEDPPHPVEENPAALHAALLLGIPSIQVILSGEWEVALREGLVSQCQYEENRALLQSLEDAQEPALPDS